MSGEERDGIRYLITHGWRPAETSENAGGRILSPQCLPGSAARHTPETVAMLWPCFPISADTRRDAKSWLTAVIDTKWA
jgi:hypothetical protein